MKNFIRILKLIGFLLLLFFGNRAQKWLTLHLVSAEAAEVLINFLVFALGANLVIIALSLFYRRRKRLAPGLSDNVLAGLNNIFYLLLAGGIPITVLGMFGIDARTLFTSLSIVAAAIAIVSKDYFNEIISGIIISFSRDISINDYVKVGEHKGKILDINLSKISLLNEDDDIIFIPNHKVFSSEIINYTTKEIKRVNIPFEVDLKLLSTIEELENNLIQSLEDYHVYSLTTQNL